MKTKLFLVSILLLVGLTSCSQDPAGPDVPPIDKPVAPVAPTITSQPASVSVVAGQTATFSVSATGTAPLSYQWQKNGTDVVGATNASYTFTTTLTDSGSRFCAKVSNSVGNAMCNSAMLVVQTPAPIIAIGQPLHGGTIFWLDPANPGHGLVAANFDQYQGGRGNTTPAQRDSMCASYGEGYRLPDSTELRKVRSAKIAGILTGFVVATPPYVSVYVSNTYMAGNPGYVSSLDINTGQRSWGGSHTPDYVRAILDF